MDRLREALGRSAGRTFAALRNRNYRLYFVGQIISVSGTWMQGVAQAWLVLRLTDSGVALGTMLAAQFLPVLLIGPAGGLVADRVDKHRLLLATQTVSGLLALTLGVLTATGVVELWMVYVLAAGLGLVHAIDNPARQTFVPEMVGPELVTNAVSLNSVVMNASRVVGPGIAGILIATVDIAPCFFINAASYLAVLAALLLMRRADLQRAELATRSPGQLRAGFRYVWSTPALRTPLLMMAAVGTLAYEFQVTLPLMARFEFDAGAGAFGAMSSLMGAGAVVGGLVSASRGGPTSRRLTGSAVAFGLLILVVAAMPTLALELVALPVMGAASITFIAMANSTLQLTAEPAMRGRVMALYAVAFLGSTPVGAPIVGAIGEAFGPRSALAVGGAATVLAGLIGARSLARHERGPAPDDAAPAAPAGAGVDLAADQPA
ncbi:MAG TPA: MFS transporter [Acidimicrobiales bacterium]